MIRASRRSPAMSTRNSKSERCPDYMKMLSRKSALDPSTAFDPVSKRTANGRSVVGERCKVTLLLMDPTDVLAKSNRVNVFSIERQKLSKFALNKTGYLSANLNTAPASGFPYSRSSIPSLCTMTVSVLQ